MLKRKTLENAVVFAIGFMIPLSLVGCGKNMKGLVTRQSMAPTPTKSVPQQTSAGPLAVYSVTAAISAETGALSISWEVAANLQGFYDIWTCAGPDGSTCSAFAVVDCVSAPGSCTAYDPNTSPSTDQTSNNGPIQFSISTMSSGHQLVTMTDSQENSLPNTSIGVDARDASDNIGPVQFSF